MTQIITDAIAGPFRATWAGPGGANPTAAHLGVIGARGVRQIRRHEAEEYSADLLGTSIVEGVYMGGQCFLEFELEEANLATALALTNPNKISPASGQYDQGNELGVPGTFMTSKAGTLVLSPLYSKTGTTHTTAGAQTTPIRTYGLCNLAAGFDQEQLFSSKRKIIPVRLRCYPYSDAGSPPKYIWYSLSAIDTTYNID